MKEESMLSQIKEQIKRLDMEASELYPEFTDIDNNDHESTAKCAIAELNRIKKLLFELEERDEKILFLLYCFYSDVEGKIPPRVMYAVSGIVEEVCGEDMIERFVKMYETPTRFVSPRWPMMHDDDARAIGKETPTERLTI